jgi:glutaredoxin 3
VSAAVTMYTKTWCPYCARARALFDKKGVAFTDIDIEASAGRRDEMLTRSGRHTVPQIFIGDRHVGGCDDLHALDAAGDLDPLLRETL